MPKPVLSDSLFNADDVATAVLAEANLQVANSDLGVTDVSDKFVRGSSWFAYGGVYCFKFNGFVFVNLSAYIAGSSLMQNLIPFTISDSNLHPSVQYRLTSISKEGDSSAFIAVNTNGEVVIDAPLDLGSNPSFHITVNGWYRI